MSKNTHVAKDNKVNEGQSGNINNNGNGEPSKITNVNDGPSDIINVNVAPAGSTNFNVGENLIDLNASPPTANNFNATTPGLNCGFRLGPGGEGLRNFGHGTRNVNDGKNFNARTLGQNSFLPGPSGMGLHHSEAGPSNVGNAGPGVNDVHGEHLKMRSLSGVIRGDYDFVRPGFLNELKLGYQNANVIAPVVPPEDELRLAIVAVEDQPGENQRERGVLINEPLNNMNHHVRPGRAGVITVERYEPRTPEERTKGWIDRKLACRRPEGKSQWERNYIHVRSDIQCKTYTTVVDYIRDNRRPRQIIMANWQGGRNPNRRSPGNVQLNMFLVGYIDMHYQGELNGHRVYNFDDRVFVSSNRHQREQQLEGMMPLPAGYTHFLFDYELRVENDHDAPNAPDDPNAPHATTALAQSKSS